MRLSLSVAALLVLNASGSAATLPLAGPYGSPWACAILATDPSILSDTGPALGVPETGYDDDELMMLVLPNRSVSTESGCNFDTVTEGKDGWAVTARCGDQAQNWKLAFDLSVDGANATIVFDDGATFPLKRCGS